MPSATGEMNSAAITTPRTNTGKLGWVIIVLALVGLVLSSISLKDHYANDESACDVNATFNCDIVNRSIYSSFGPVPVAAIGMAGYLVLMVLARVARSRGLALIMLLGALGGLAFALYLTYIEARVLFTWCLLCLGSLATISLITALTAWRTVRVWRST